MLETSARNSLIDLAETFAAATGVSLATIGKRALNDNTFLTRIVHGQTFTVRTYDRVVQWLSDNWPKDAPWPSSVERPKKKSRAA